MAINLHDVNASFHSIKISDGTDTLAIAADGSIAVTSTDLDIRDISHTSDSIKIGDGTDFLAIAADGSIAVTDNGNSLTVDASDLDIRDLTHVSDSVKIGDGTETANVNASNELQVRDDDANTLLGTIDADTSALAGCVDGTELQVDIVTMPDVNVVLDSFDTWKATDQDVTNSASELAATPLSGRKSMIIQNLGSVDAYIGPDNTVTALTGTMVPKGGSIEKNWSDTANVWAITSAGTADLRISEYAS